MTSSPPSPIAAFKFHFLPLSSLLLGGLALFFSSAWIDRWTVPFPARYPVSFLSPLRRCFRRGVLTLCVGTEKDAFLNLFPCTRSLPYGHFVFLFIFPARSHLTPPGKYPSSLSPLPALIQPVPFPPPDNAFAVRQVLFSFSGVSIPRHCVASSRTTATRHTSPPLSLIAGAANLVFFFFGDKMTLSPLCELLLVVFLSDVAHFPLNSYFPCPPRADTLLGSLISPPSLNKLAYFSLFLHKRDYFSSCSFFLCSSIMELHFPRFLIQVFHVQSSPVSTPSRVFTFPFHADAPHPGTPPTRGSLHPPLPTPPM